MTDLILLIAPFQHGETNKPSASLPFSSAFSSLKKLCYKTSPIHRRGSSPNRHSMKMPIYSKWHRCEPNQKTLCNKTFTLSQLGPIHPL
jgi:hypothetical protein